MEFVLHDVSASSQRLCGGAEKSPRAELDVLSQCFQSDDRAESIAEKLDIFPSSRSGYMQKVRAQDSYVPARALAGELYVQRHLAP